MTEQGKENSTLCAIYDLGVFPTSFDLAPFLLAAQGEALERGCSRVRLLLVDGDHQGVRFEGDEYEALYPPSMRNWKVSHILQALPRLCPLVERTVSIVPRDELPLYHARYTNVMICDDYNGIYLSAWRRLDRYRVQLGFRATPAAHYYLQNWMASESPCPDKPLVCLTLRENRWSTDRNSDLTMWTEIVTLLHEDGYWPVVVPDTDMAFVKRGPEWHAATFCAPAALDLELRMALYEKAHLNLFTSAGPAFLAIGSQKCRYLYTGITSEGTSESSLAKLRQIGGIPGLMPFRPGPYQQWIWEPVTKELMWQAISSMTRGIGTGTSFIDFPYFAEPFDEDYYLSHSPEVGEALRKGQVRSALDHYVRMGAEAGKRPAAQIRPPSAAILSRLFKGAPQTELDAIINSGSCWFDKGIQHYERGELTQAESCFQEALALTPAKVTVLVSLARVCYDQHRHLDAQKYLQEARKLAPGDKNAWNEATRMAHAKISRAISAKHDHSTRQEDVI